MMVDRGPDWEDAASEYRAKMGALRESETQVKKGLLFGSIY